MAQQIIGLDIGTHAVKIARCRRTVGGLRWLESAQHELSRTETRGEAVPAAIKALLGNGDLRTSRVVLGIPSHLVSSRLLTLPFLRVEQVRQVVPFEMESHLPLPLDDVVVEAQLLSAREGATQVLAVALPKAGLREYLDLCRTAGLDPAVVDAEAFVLARYARYAVGESEGSMAVIDIGAAKTTLCVTHGHQPQFVRAILIGGDVVTAAVQEALALSAQEAEQWKRSRQVREEPIAHALEPLVAEIRRSLHACESAGGTTVPALFFTGGGSALEGLPAYLAERLGKRLVTSQIAGRIAGRSGLDQLGPGFATAVGLALAAAAERATGPGATAVNFRRGEFAVPREARRRGRWVATVAAGLLVLLAGTDLFLHGQVLERRHRALKAQLRRQFQSAVPEATVVVDEVQQFKAAMLEMKRKAALFGSGRTPGLNFLVALSEQMPRDLAVEIQDLTMEQGKVTLDAETDSFNSIDRLKGVVERLDGVTEVKVSEARVAADQTKVKFRLTLTVHRGA